MMPVDGGVQIVGTAHARCTGNILIGNAYSQVRFISCCYAGWIGSESSLLSPSLSFSLFFPAL